MDTSLATLQTLPLLDSYVPLSILAFLVFCASFKLSVDYNTDIEIGSYGLEYISTKEEKNIGNCAKHPLFPIIHEHKVG
jgi:hypothetical protein